MTTEYTVCSVVETKSLIDTSSDDAMITNYNSARQFISGNGKDKQLADQDKKDLSSEETNFLSIPLYSSERTGRERKKPLPKEFLKEWNKEIQDSGALNPKKELD